MRWRVDEAEKDSRRLFQVTETAKHKIVEPRMVQVVWSSIEEVGGKGTDGGWRAKPEDRDSLGLKA